MYVIVNHLIMRKGYSTFNACAPVSVKGALDSMIMCLCGLGHGNQLLQSVCQAFTAALATCIAWRAEMHRLITCNDDLSLNLLF